MTSNISLCYIIFEMEENKDDTKVSNEGASKDTRSDVTQGRRESREYTIETYSGSKLKPKPMFLKSRSVSESSTRFGDSATEYEQGDGSQGAESDKESKSFISGNPFVETTRGILHLYKENCLSTLEAGSERCESVCILAVPATMTCHDLLTFTGPVHEDVKHIRIIRDGTPNQYMALLTFRSQLMAREFYTSFNGVAFNSLEPECVCQLVFVSGIEVNNSAPKPPPSHTELPTCPVCLERMDESVDGILTILCNHSFHSHCLAKWGDTSCPVCRYFQTPVPTEDNRCLQCLSEENLWMCLICGHVGCGRYVQGHAYEHYEETQHCYAMQVGCNRVWDYAGDNFVHRLFQNKGDGKLVEGEQPSKDTGFEEKFDSMQLEWTYHLTSQLDQQKLFFEEKLARVQSSLSSETSELRQKLIKSLDENKTLQDQLQFTKNEKVGLEKKLTTLTSKLSSSHSQMQDEREMSKALQKNQTEWQAKFSNIEKELKNKDKELADMKEQLRDVMFYFEAQKQIASSDLQNEIADGQIVIPETTNSTRGRRKRR